MARSRRRATSRPRRAFTGRRPRPDWVYRSNAIRSDGTADLLGTYKWPTFSVTSGKANASILMLYDSQNYLRQPVNTLTGSFFLAQSGRAEGAKPLCLRVQGQIYSRPSTWALGNVLAYGLRILVVEQDPETGLGTIDADFGMWQPTVAGKEGTWRNPQQIVWEKRYWRSYSSNETSPSLILPIDVRMRRRLKSNEALALYMETADTSVTAVFQMWLRTLVVDEG